MTLSRFHGKLQALKSWCRNSFVLDQDLEDSTHRSGINQAFQLETRLQLLRLRLVSVVQVAELIHLAQSHEKTLLGGEPSRFKPGFLARVDQRAEIDVSGQVLLTRSGIEAFGSLVALVRH